METPSSHYPSEWSIRGATFESSQQPDFEQTFCAKGHNRLSSPVFGRQDSYERHNGKPHVPPAASRPIC